MTYHALSETTRKARTPTPIVRTSTYGDGDLLGELTNQKFKRRSRHTHHKAVLAILSYPAIDNALRNSDLTCVFSTITLAPGSRQVLENLQGEKDVKEEAERYFYNYSILLGR